MSRRAVSWIFALLFVALTSLSARAAPARPILTDASTDAWWLVTQRAPVNPSRVTTPQPWGDIRRLDLENNLWTPVSALARPPISIASVDDRLAILFDDETWAFAWPGTLMPGSPLPKNLRPLALASEGSKLWFLARNGPLPPASDESEFFTATTAPTNQLWLISYERARFSGPILVKDETESFDQSTYTLARFAQNEFTIVRHKTNGAVDWWRWSNENGLKALTPSQANEQYARAIAGFGKPAYFSIASDGRAQIVFDQNSTISLQPDPIFNHQSTDASIVRGEIRLARIEQNKARAQTLSLDGTARSKAAVLPIGNEAQSGAWMMRLILTTALLPVLLWSFSQPPGQPIQLTVTPAPLYLRAIAGMIDAPFIFLGVFFLGIARAIQEIPMDAPYTETDFVLVALSMASYLIYTTLFEFFVGRTPGKMLLGLRVVRPDGSKPEGGRLVARNLARAIDVAFFPLLLTMLLPARQRMGDLIANTVVVRDSAIPRDSTQNKESVNQSPPEKGQRS
ncbi:MAG TPA: RDD family protein [Tepidisphaeraceae bacterium]|nr:RDD family protein [Tepidisphaeraceae bacterium]